MKHHDKRLYFLILVGQLFLFLFLGICRLLFLSSYSSPVGETNRNREPPSFQSIHHTLSTSKSAFSEIPRTSPLIEGPSRAAKAGQEEGRRQAEGVITGDSTRTFFSSSEQESHFLLLKALVASQELFQDSCSVYWSSFALPLVLDPLEALSVSSEDFDRNALTHPFDQNTALRLTVRNGSLFCMRDETVRPQKVKFFEARSLLTRIQKAIGMSAHSRGDSQLDGLTFSIQMDDCPKLYKKHRRNADTAVEKCGKFGYGESVQQTGIEGKRQKKEKGLRFVEFESEREAIRPMPSGTVPSFWGSFSSDLRFPGPLLSVSASSELNWDIPALPYLHHNNREETALREALQRRKDGEERWTSKEATGFFFQGRLTDDERLWVACEAEKRRERDKNTGGSTSSSSSSSSSVWEDVFIVEDLEKSKTVRCREAAVEAERQNGCAAERVCRAAKIAKITRGEDTDRKRGGHEKEGEFGEEREKTASAAQVQQEVKAGEEEVGKELLKRYASHRFALDIPGVGPWSSRLRLLLLGGAVVFQSRRAFRHAQFFDGPLKDAGVISGFDSIEELEEKRQYLMSNVSLAESLSLVSRKISSECLTQEGIRKFLHLFLHRLKSLQGGRAGENESVNFSVKESAGENHDLNYSGKETRRAESTLLEETSPFDWTSAATVDDSYASNTTKPSQAENENNLSLLELKWKATNLLSCFPNISI